MRSTEEIREMEMDLEGEIEDTHQHHFHVLAVDDSLIDRKLLEKLLKTSSYKGIYDSMLLSLSMFILNLFPQLYFTCL